MPSLRTTLACCALALLSCAEAPSSMPPSFTARFPAARERLEGRVPFKWAGGELRAARQGGALQLVLPGAGAGALRLSLPGLPRVEVRELGLAGPAQVELGAVGYERAQGRSWWVATSAGYEEFVEAYAATAEPVAEWEVTGARLQQVGEAALLVDDEGLGRVHVTAPAAWDAQGNAGRAWLEVRGARLALFTDLRGHVLVDPLWNATVTSLPSGMAVSRATVTQLLDGRLLVAGGDTGFGSSSGSALYEPSSGKWTSQASMQRARRGHAATLLKDGRVLVTGGETDGIDVLDHGEVFNPTTGAWTLLSAGVMGARYQHTATLLGDGRVLVVGGFNSFTASDASLTTAALFDPVANTFASTGALMYSRGGHRAVRLQDGRVLAISGATTVASTALRLAPEAFNPATGTWATRANLSIGRRDFSATVLADGQVLVAGGFRNNGTPLLECERYDPIANTWALTGPLGTSRAAHVAALLPTGRVLVAGGTSDAGVLATVEQYEPTTGTWASAEAMPVARTSASAGLLYDGKVLVIGGVNATGTPQDTAVQFDPTADAGTSVAGPALATGWRQGALVLLPSGQVLVAGGRTGAGGALATSYLFSPDAGTLTPTGSLAAARYDFGATLLSTGEVLVAGGTNGTSTLASAELYSPATGQWRATGSLTPARRNFTLTTRLDGTAVAVGGTSGSNPVPDVHLYLPETGQWTSAAAPAVNRSGHTATMTYSGDVLVAGGWTDGGVPTGSVFTFNHDGGWTIQPTIINGRVQHSAALLHDGRVMLASGVNSGGSPLNTVNVWSPSLDGGTGSMSTLTSLGSEVRAEATPLVLTTGKVLLAGGRTSTSLVNGTLVYDPGRNGWDPGPALSARATPGAVLLTNGKGLVVGGATDAGAASTVRLFDEGLGAAAALTPTLTALTPTALAPSATLTGAGTLFEGVGEGGRGGGDHFASNVPLLRLRGVESERWYFVKPSSWSPTSLTATLPPEVPTGYYFASVVVGGVPSEQRPLEYFAPVFITPTAVTVPPRGAQTFGADGGTGFFRWEFASNNSGGTVVNGLYTAGAVGSVTDVVRVVDRKGRSATATITVTAGVTVTPATVTLPPRGTQTFGATGGSGTGFAWSLQVGSSGGGINGSSGAYTAGSTGGVSDVVRVQDSLGNVGTATVTVTAGVSINPASASGPPRSTRTFSASGGSGTGFTWALLNNASGGSIDSGTGAYTAGPNSGVDTVRVTDSLGNTATATYDVGPRVSIAPASASLAPLGTRTFAASGGSGVGFTWSLTATGSSGGSSPSVSSAGVYTAGSSQGLDVVRVVDSLGNEATANVDVTTMLRVTPSTQTLPPRAGLVFSASGGTGTGYVWTLLSNASGATFDPGTASYTAGVTGGVLPDGGAVVDVVQVTDSNGAMAEGRVTISQSVFLTPASATLPPRSAQGFVAQGGSGTGFTYALTPNASGATLDGGAYVAGATGSVTDVLVATDDLGNTASASITVTPAIAIAPAMPVVPPSGTVDFVASGGAGSGYTWILDSAPSGGTVNQFTGAYRAGGMSGVDQLRVRDALGNEAQTSRAVGK